MVGTSPSDARDAGLIPGQGTLIPHVLQPKNQNIKQKQYCTKFNKVFKNGPHEKNLKKKKNLQILPNVPQSRGSTNRPSVVSFFGLDM